MAEACANGEGNGGKCGRFQDRNSVLWMVMSSSNNLLIEFPTIIDTILSFCHHLSLNYSDSKGKHLRKVLSCLLFVLFFFLTVWIGLHSTLECYCISCARWEACWGLPWFNPYMRLETADVWFLIVLIFSVNPSNFIRTLFLGLSLIN